jgi:hypothetical protein
MAMDYPLYGGDGVQSLSLVVKIYPMERKNNNIKRFINNVKID